MSDSIRLEWQRWPTGVTYEGSRLIVHGKPQTYALEYPHKGIPPAVDLAAVRTPEEAASFIRHHGKLTDDPKHEWWTAFEDEAKGMRACLDIWRRLVNPTLMDEDAKEWIALVEALKQLRELRLGSDGEWETRFREIRTKAPTERAIRAARLWFWKELQDRLRKASLVLAYDTGPKDPPYSWFDAPFRWEYEVPDLLTFCYVELALEIARKDERRIPALCPFCGRVYLVRKAGQRTCGQQRCRTAAVRAGQRQRKASKQRGVRHGKR